MITHETLRTWIEHFATLIDASSDELNRLDAALGDGDFGASMQRGMSASVAALSAHHSSSVGEVLRLTGSTIISAIGGTSGPLVGSFFLRAGMDLGDPTECTLADLGAALQVGTDAVRDLGGAEVGDKTMVDALEPAVQELNTTFDSNGDTAAATASAAAIAATAAAQTANLAARRGRASYTGDGGIGHVDPGAQGVALLFTALATATNTN